MNQSVMGRKNRIALLVHKYFLEAPPNIREENHQYYVLSISTFMGVVIHGLLIPSFWFLGVKQLALFNILSVSLFILAGFLNRRGYHLTSGIICCIEVCIHQTLCVVFMGWSAGFQYYFFILPMGLYLMHHGNEVFKIFLGLTFYLNYSLLDYFFRVSDPILILNPLILTIFNYSNIFVLFVFLCVAGFLLLSRVYSVETELIKEQHKVKKAYGLLSKYVPPQLANLITDGQIEDVWQHSRKKLTLFFSDIKDFTIITDALEPEDMAAVLNEYLTEMNTIINKYNGTLAQVIGDGLYVIFGAPKSSSDEDNALSCVKMAIDMQKKMNELNKRWFKKGIEEVLQIRCGINTGMTTVGGYGSSERKEYTAMGMQTNIAARLEQSCTPGGILISHTTWALVSDQISCSEHGKINVKGLSRAIRAYGIDTLSNQN